jgi:hypothetical protein
MMHFQSPDIIHARNALNSQPGMNLTLIERLPLLEAWSSLRVATSESILLFLDVVVAVSKSNRLKPEVSAGLTSLPISQQRWQS